MSQEENRGEKLPDILRGKVDSLSLYEITDHELYILEKGYSSSLFLNFGIALFSIGISFFIALHTSQITSDLTSTVFTVVTSVGLSTGLLLMGLWYRDRQPIAPMIKKIKSRIPKKSKLTEQDEDA